MIEDNNLRIREIFSILTQGVEMKQYETNPQTFNSSVNQRIVWMDSDIYRICAATVRPSMAERAQGKIPPGIYLRDISEIREGSDSFHFLQNKTPPEDPNCCLSLVGSERTISLEFPSKFTRDWFLVRFRLLAEDILVEQERLNRKYKIWENYRQLNSVEIQYVSQLQALLDRGIQVSHHQLSGKIVDGVIRYEADTNTLVLYTQIPGFLGMKETLMSLNISDISEVRPGSHSLAFVRTNSTENDGETLSVISSENVFDLQFISRKARDLFAERLHLFILFFLVTKKSDAEEQENSGTGGVQFDEADVDI